MSERRKHFSELEALRGIAATFVVFHHMNWSSHISELEMIDQSSLFVDFFFVLSGFVISHAYRSRLSTVLQVREFAIRRFYRLYPLHFFMLLVFLAYEISYVLFATWVSAGGGGEFAHLDPHLENNLFSFVTNLLLIDAFGFHTISSWNGPSWSISAEVGAYSLFAGICLAVAFLKRAFLLMCMFVSVTSLVVLSFNGGDQWLTFTADLGLIRCLFGFFAGVVLHQFWLLVEEQWSIRRAKWHDTLIEILAIVAVVVALTVLQTNQPNVYLIVPIFALVILVFAAGRGNVSKFLRTRALNRLGVISYSIYMTHYILIRMATVPMRLSGKFVTSKASGSDVVIMSPWLGDLFVLVVLCIVLAVSNISYNRIEDRFRKGFRASKTVAKSGTVL